tara:strand:+ start:129 stop:608 length:480 start_codon:yes stop_codon:yes gene_type:complete
MKKNILFVCLGNICRSPAAEAVFLNQIRSRGIEQYFKVDSAGTGGWHVGNDADSRMRKAALRRSIDIRSKARQISLQDFKIFDLILTMDNANLREVQLLSKEVLTKNIAEISPILSYSSNSNLIEVPDPYYGGEDGFNIVLDLLEDAISNLIDSFNLKD